MKLKLTHTLTLLAAALLVASCNMMSDSRVNCPVCNTQLHVTLKYDYNMQRADMFNDHVGAVTCYLLDTDGNILDFQTALNTPDEQPIQSHNFAFNFQDIDQGTYRLAAVAAQRPLTSTLNPLPATLNIGDNIADLTYTLSTTDNNPTDTPTAAAPTAASSPTAAALAPASSPANSPLRAPVQGGFSALSLDTIWHALNPHTVQVITNETAYDTLSLLRLTNNLNLTLTQLDNPTGNGHDHYIVTVTDHNAHLNHQAEPLPSEPLTTYIPYAAWTTETLDTTPDKGDDTTSGDADTTDETAPVALRTAHYDLSLSRLLIHDDATRNARLLIQNAQDGTPIVDIDLIHYLTLARTAAERTLPPQEFLDREYDYRLSFVLQGNQWRYMTISISLLSWSIRIQNEQL